MNKLFFSILLFSTLLNVGCVKDTKSLSEVSEVAVQGYSNFYVSKVVILATNRSSANVNASVVDTDNITYHTSGSYYINVSSLPDEITYVYDEFSSHLKVGKGKFGTSIEIRLSSSYGTLSFIPNDILGKSVVQLTDPSTGLIANVHFGWS